MIDLMTVVIVAIFTEPTAACLRKKVCALNCADIGAQRGTVKLRFSAGVSPHKKMGPLMGYGSMSVQISK